VLAETSIRMVVLDPGSLPTAQEQHLVAEAVLSALWETRLERRPCLVVVDEAHNICPAECPDAVTGLSTDLAVQVAAEGRRRHPGHLGRAAELTAAPGGAAARRPASHSKLPPPTGNSLWEAADQQANVVNSRSAEASPAEDLRLLRGELRLGQDTLLLELGELLELLDPVRGRGRGRRRRLLLIRLLVVGGVALGDDLGVAVGELLGLPALHPSADRGGRPRDDRGPRHSPK
jgi:hypothetical protein